MRIILFISVFFTLNVFAQENAFRLNVGSLASGLSYVKEGLDLESDDTKDTEKYHVAFGYLRHIGKNFQAVANASYKYENVELGDVESENNEAVLEIGALYNLGNELKSSFYGGILYYHSERFQGDYDDAADAEVEGSVGGIELTLGKRFNLVENLSYVLSVDYITGLSFGGDFKDVYDGGSIVRVNLATLEYYF